MMEALSEGPVSIAIEADSIFFQLYHGGIFSSGFCGANLDHGVLAVGYGTDNGKGYWKVKNSWGESFGEKGYIRLGGFDKKTGECGMLKQPSYPVVAKSDELTGIWDEIKALVCEALESGGSKEEVEDLVCAEIEKELPVPDSLCKELAGKAYDMGVDELECDA